MAKTRSEPGIPCFIAQSSLVQKLHWFILGTWQCPHMCDPKGATCAFCMHVQFQYTQTKHWIFTPYAKYACSLIQSFRQHISCSSPDSAQDHFVAFWCTSNCTWENLISHPRRRMQDDCFHGCSYDNCGHLLASACDITWIKVWSL